MTAIPAIHINKWVDLLSATIVFISFLGESAGAGLFSETTGGGEAGFAAYRFGVRAGENDEHQSNCGSHRSMQRLSAALNRVTVRQRTYRAVFLL
jgi:hypothetical protein